MVETARSMNKNTLIKWLVLFGDVLLYCALVYFVSDYFKSYTPQSVWRHVPIAVVLGEICLVMFSLMVPSVVHRRRVDVQEIVARNALIAFLTQLAFGLLWHMLTVDSSDEISYSSILALSLFVTLVMKRMVEISLLGYLRRKGRNSRAVLLIGSDPANLNIYREIMSDPTTGYNVIGYFSNNEIKDAPENLKRLGTRVELIEMLENHPDDVPHVDEIFCSLSHRDQEDIEKILRYCDKKIVHFYYVPRIFHSMQMLLKPEMMGRNVVYTNHYEPLTAWGNRAVKRMFDIVFSSLVLLCILPLIPIIYCIVKIQSPGPLLFRQKRTGMNGLDFTCYKFRSMHVNKDADVVQATKNDPRKFAFGNFMRKTNIDELPQFFNVLKGDMSVVGPRPHMKLHTKQYSALIEKYMVRHCAKPGITGWAQVTGYRGETEELWQMEGRIQKDIWYIENWSLWLDIRICAITALSIIIPDKKAY